MRANRANASKSTGPRTPEGKARVARYSLIHGLAAAHLASPIHEVDRLSAVLIHDAGVACTPIIEAAARDLADAQLHVLSVRAIRLYYWLQVASTQMLCLGQPEAVKGEPASCEYRQNIAEIEAMAMPRVKRHEPLRSIKALERYERQALARRKWASRAFSEAVAQARPSARSAG